MKVKITSALNKYFKNDTLAISGFKCNKDETAGFIKTYLFFNDNEKTFGFVSTREAEITEQLFNTYPVFERIIERFMLPLPGRVLADGKNPAAFIYPELTFIVAPAKEV